MKKSLVLRAGTVVAGMLLSAPGFGQASVDAYVAASQNSDPTALIKALGGAAYVDGDFGRDVDAADLPRVVGKYVGPSLKLLSRKTVGDTVELSWSLGNGAVDFTDTLTLSSGKISQVVTQGVPAAPADVAWVDRFTAARSDSTEPVFRPFFVKTARIFGRSFPREGSTVDEDLKFLANYSGTLYSRLPNSPVLRAKDGHLYYQFEVHNPSGSILVSGTDHLYRQGELVSKFVGVY